MPLPVRTQLDLLVSVPNETRDQLAAEDVLPSTYLLIVTRPSRSSIIVRLDTHKSEVTPNVP